MSKSTASVATRLAQFERALLINRSMGALPAVCATQCELARALQRDGRSPEARQHAHDGLALARELGMPMLASKAEQLIAALDATSERAAAIDTPQQFACQGAVWRLCYRGRSTHAADQKGMHYLAMLLARPGQEVHVLELSMLAHGADAQPTRHTDRSAVRRRSVESFESTLDAESIASYRLRVFELGEELEEAENMNDLARKEACVRERELLRRELLTGARARHRPTERARKAVYNRIRQAIEHIDIVHPELARHLLRTVKTGTHCVYAPEDETAWQLSASCSAPRP